MKYLLKFQEQHGLSVDGIIGKQVITQMIKLWGLSPAQLAHFLANIDNETGGFSTAFENLNYDAQGLANTWPTRYAVNSKAKKKAPNDLAFKIQKQPIVIANKTYADRNGNGSEASGDGWRFRGRGGIQTTGKTNYRLLAEYVKDKSVISNPDIVASLYFWESALCYFTTGKLWKQMLHSDSEAVKSVRKAVNGGYIGLDHVQLSFTYYHNLINKVVNGNK